MGPSSPLGLSGPQNGVADPEGSHLLVLARGVEGYHRLAGAMTEAHFRGDEKGRPVYDLDELAAMGRDHWLVLTGCRKGSVRQALASGGREAAATELDRLTAMFGHDNVVVELIDHGFPTDSVTNDALAALAADHGLADRGDQQRALRQARLPPARRRDGSRTSAPQPGRHGRLAADVELGPPAIRCRDAWLALRAIPGAVQRSVDDR